MGLTMFFDYESDIRNPRKGVRGAVESKAFHPFLH